MHSSWNSSVSYCNICVEPFNKQRKMLSVNWLLRSYWATSCYQLVTASGVDRLPYQLSVDHVQLQMHWFTHCTSTSPGAPVDWMCMTYLYQIIEMLQYSAAGRLADAHSYHCEWTSLHICGSFNIHQVTTVIIIVIVIVHSVGSPTEWAVEVF